MQKLRGSLVLGKNGEEVQISGAEFGYEEEGSFDTGLIYKIGAILGEDEVEVKVVFWPNCYDRYEVTTDDEDVEVVKEDLMLNV